MTYTIRRYKRRDYAGKRQQYQELGVFEYWIVDPHQAKVTVLVLADGEYQEFVYSGDDTIVCANYPAISLDSQ